MTRSKKHSRQLGGPVITSCKRLRGSVRQSYSEREKNRDREILRNRNGSRSRERGQLLLPPLPLRLLLLQRRRKKMKSGGKIIIGVKLRQKKVGARFSDHVMQSNLSFVQNKLVERLVF